MSTAPPDMLSLPRIVELAKLVHEKLPREVRDIVYSFLWDDEVMKKLDYSSQLCLVEKCEYTSDDTVNTICLCDRPETIPKFAQSAIVGYQFAYESAIWLYENYQDFSVASPDSARRFFEQDVFHIGITPSVSTRRQLTVEFDVFEKRFHKTLEYKLRCLEYDFTAFYGSHLSNGSRLEIVLKVSQETDSIVLYLYALSMVVQGFTPIISDIEEYGKVIIVVTYNHGLYGRFDMKHMLGPTTMDHWMTFVEMVLTVRIRQTLEAGMAERVIADCLRLWRGEWYEHSRACEFERSKQILEWMRSGG